VLRRTVIPSGWELLNLSVGRDSLIHLFIAALALYDSGTRLEAGVGGREDESVLLGCVMFLGRVLSLGCALKVYETGVWTKGRTWCACNLVG
jgi:hypothetical protein